MFYKLNSITAVMDGASGTITQAQDYDAWGDICRTYSTTDTTVNKFTGKERDQETGYDYFGARYYDSRIGRWLQTEPLLESYLKLSPYLYGNYNAINIFDIVGDTLELGGNIEKSLNYLKMLIPNIYKDKISISKDENNFVSLNYSSGVYIYDSGLEILGNLINSDKKFLFEVTDNTTGIARVSSNKYLQGEIINFNLNTTSGILNLSITPRNINGGSGHSDFLPKGNYAGQISIGSGNWTAPNSNNFIPKGDIVFHELRENYFRTIEKEPYMRNDPNRTGAHNSAILKSSYYINQSKYKSGNVGKYEN